MQDYSIGGQERKGNDANEAIADIQKNRTLLVQKLTADAPARPRVEEKLETVEAVFERFKPEIEIDFEDAEGTTIPENLHFRNLGDFGKKGITAQSQFLQNLTNQQADMQNFAKQLRSNKVLQKLLADPAGKAAYLNALRAMIQELEDAR